MSIRGAANKGRAAAERIMVDTCRIYRLGGTALNTGTGAVTRAETTLYTGKCRVKAETGTSVGDVGAGESAVSRVTPIVSVPITVTDLKAGDRVQITATDDGHLRNKTLLVRAVQTGSFITAHRLICEVLTQ